MLPCVSNAPGTNQAEFATENRASGAGAIVKNISIFFLS